MMNIKESIKQRIVKDLVNRERAREESIVMSQIPDSVRSPLTEAERQAVDIMWGKITTGGVILYPIKNWRYINFLMASIRAIWGTIYIYPLLPED